MLTILLVNWNESKMENRSLTSYTRLSRSEEHNFSPTNSLFSIYLYLTSIIKYVIYLPLPNSINFLWVTKSWWRKLLGYASVWLRTSLVTKSPACVWEIVHKIVKKWRTQFFLRKFLIFHLSLPDFNYKVRDLFAITQFNQFPLGTKSWWRKLLGSHQFGYEPVWLRSLQLALM